MWFPSFYLTVEDRVDNLVTYESMGIPYRIIKRDYKKPRHKAEKNRPLTTTNPTMISQEEDIKYVYITEIPAQEPPTKNSSSSPTTQ